MIPRVVVLIVCIVCIVVMCGNAFCQQQYAQQYAQQQAQQYQPQQQAGAGQAQAGGGYTGGGGYQESVTVLPSQQFWTLIYAALPPSAERRIAQVDGALVITDTATNQRLIRKILDSLTQIPPQIAIETKFIDVSVSRIDELGIQWDQTGFISPMTGDSAGIIRKGFDDFSEASASTNLSTQTSEGLTFRYTSLGDTSYRAILHALEQSGKASLLSEPRIMALNHQPANIQVIQNVPYISDVSIETLTIPNAPTQVYQNYSANTLNIGITLEVTAHVGEDSDVIALELRPTVDTLVRQIPLITGIAGAAPIPQELGYPVIDRRTTDTMVLVKSGETIVIGGLIRDSDTTTEKGIPLLKDIPLFGNLFKNKYTSKTKANLLIFITATLVNPSGSPIVYSK
jgi:type II secretory pathway component GspD/PulD (secretin)